MGKGSPGHGDGTHMGGGQSMVSAPGCPWWGQQCEVARALAPTLGAQGRWKAPPWDTNVGLFEAGEAGEPPWAARLGQRGQRAALKSISLLRPGAGTEASPLEWGSP